ncbi:unnamed protein product [Sphagnum compactum]
MTTVSVKYPPLILHLDNNILSALESFMIDSQVAFQQTSTNTLLSRDSMGDNHNRYILSQYILFLYLNIFIKPTTIQHYRDVINGVCAEINIACQNRQITDRGLIDLLMTYQVKGSMIARGRIFVDALRSAFLRIRPDASYIGLDNVFKIVAALYDDREAVAENVVFYTIKMYFIEGFDQPTLGMVPVSKAYTLRTGPYVSVPDLSWKMLYSLNVASLITKPGDVTTLLYVIANLALPMDPIELVTEIRIQTIANKKAGIPFLNYLAMYLKQRMLGFDYKLSRLARSQRVLLYNLHRFCGVGATYIEDTIAANYFMSQFSSITERFNPDSPSEANDPVTEDEWAMLFYLSNMARRENNNLHFVRPLRYEDAVEASKVTKPKGSSKNDDAFADDKPPEEEPTPEPKPKNPVKKPEVAPPTDEPDVPDDVPEGDDTDPSGNTEQNNDDTIDQTGGDGSSTPIVAESKFLPLALPSETLDDHVTRVLLLQYIADMSTSDNPDITPERLAMLKTCFRAAFEHQIATEADPKDIALVNAIFTNTHNMLAQSKLISPADGAATESALWKVPALIYNAADKYSDVSVETISTFLDNCKVPQDMKYTCGMEVARILTGDCSSVMPFIDTGRQNKNQIGLSQIYSPQDVASIRDNGRQAVESFGEYTDRVTSDSRLAIAVTVLRAHRSLIDRVMPRRAAEDPVVLIKIPNPEVYNLELSQNPSAAIRFGAGNRIPLIQLYRDPSSVNTQPQQIIPQLANDTNGIYLSANNVFKAGAPDANLFDLTLNANQAGFTATDWTDLVSEGGSVGSIYLTITSGGTVETYSISTQYLRMAQFVTVTNNSDSGDRAADIKYTTALTKNAVMSNGNTSALLANFTSVDVVLNIRFSASLNIKTGNVSGSGTVTGSLFTTLSGGAGSTLTTAFNAMTFAITGWSSYLFFSEENMRKTTGAIRMSWREHEFLIPVGRNYIVDFSMMGQEVGTDTTDTTSKTIALGNSIRGINIIQNTLTAVNARLQFENANPEIDYYHSTAMDYAGGTLSLPHVYIGTIDITSSAVMRESERLSDIHSYMTSRLTALIADAHNKSMYPNNFEAGERARWKVMTSGPIAEILFGIKQYWNTLDDTVAKTEDSNYSLKLPNGTQLDIYQSNFEIFDNTILMVPIRDAKPDDVTSFGVVLDRGTFVGQYTPVQNSAANRRIVANSREILFPTNPLGFVITVKRYPGSAAGSGGRSWPVRVTLSKPNDHTRNLNVSRLNACVIVIMICNDDDVPSLWFHRHHNDGRIEPALKIVHRPERTFYVTKNEHRTHKFKKEREELDRLDRYQVPNCQLGESLSKVLNGNKFVPGQTRYHDITELSNSPYVYGADIHIETLIKHKWQKDFEASGLRPSPITTGFFDIETDVVNGAGDDPNVITVTHENRVYTAFLSSFFRVRQPDGTFVQGNIKEFEAFSKATLDRHIDKLLTEHIAKNPKSSLRTRVLKNPFEYFFYVGDTIIDIITWIMDRVHENKTDFLGIWNLDYDIPHILDSIKKAKVSYETVMCPKTKELPDKYKFTRYSPDRKQTDNIFKKWHWLHCTSYSQFVDSMCLYSILRTSKGKESYKLNDILQSNDLGGKLTFKDDDPETEEMDELEWHVYMQTNEAYKYIVYNQFDCISLQLMEWRNKDIESMYILGGVSQLCKWNRQTRKVADALYFDAIDMGTITASPGKDMATEFDKLIGKKGGAVLRPERTVDIGLKIFSDQPDLVTMLHNFTGDADFSSMYPEATIVCNISKETKISTGFEIEGHSRDATLDYYSLAISIEENAVMMGKRYFNLPGYQDIDALLDQFSLTMVIQTLRTASKIVTGKDIYLVAPRESKKAISSHGEASKDSVQEAVLADPTITIKSNKQNPVEKITEHVYDAIAHGVAFIRNHLPSVQASEKING